MKIISQFKDYYDIGLSLGEDDNVRFYRKTDQILLPLDENYINDIHFHMVDKKKENIYREWIKIEKVALSIAGEVSFVYIFKNETTENNQVFGHPDFEKMPLVYKKYREMLVSKTDPFYQDKIDYICIQPKNDWNYLKNDLKYFNKELRQKLLNRNKNLENKQNYLETKLQEKDLIPLHLELEAPILLFRKGDFDNKNKMIVIRNPNLSLLNMQTKLDSFACFQKIDQFISGVVPGQQMPMVQLTDQDLIRKKGFDPKYGFRHRPLK